MNVKKFILDKISATIEKKYEENLRNKLTNYDFSIICPNCIGGLIYHRLGIQFLSPTINLWMTQRDYMKFILNLDYYLSLSLNFINCEYEFPVARLGDVTLYFNHYNSREEAELSWNIRKKRINYDNIFLIMYDNGEISMEEIKQFKNIKCRGKIIISNNYYTDMDYIIRIPANIENPETRYRLDRNKFTGLRKFEEYFDYVTWLNHGN